MSEPDLKVFPLLAELSDEDREVLIELLEPVSVRSGRRLFRAGSESEGLALIVSGEVARRPVSVQASTSKLPARINCKRNTSSSPPRWRDAHNGPQ